MHRIVQAQAARLVQQDAHATSTAVRGCTNRGPGCCKCCGLCKLTLIHMNEVALADGQVLAHTSMEGMKYYIFSSHPRLIKYLPGPTREGLMQGLARAT